MLKILYFNINFACNNNCIFCFSHNVGNEVRQMSLQQIKRAVSFKEINTEDMIVINGGEPTLHNNFANLLDYLETVSCRCKIYTNGRNLKKVHHISGNHISYVVPILGNKMVHDTLTRCNGSFADTISSLQNLEDQGVNYALKFIVTEEMIQEKFKVMEFLTFYNLHPGEIYFARLNTTIKSKQNHYKPPVETDVKFFWKGSCRPYVKKQVNCSCWISRHVI